jgi:hypothetical protein
VQHYGQAGLLTFHIGLQMERPRLLLDPLARGEEYLPLGFACQQHHAVEADVIDINTVRQIAAGERSAELYFAIETISFDFE